MPLLLLQRSRLQARRGKLKMKRKRRRKMGCCLMD
jgi:hypothetical protein